jgi:hypothetical protein
MPIIPEVFDYDIDKPDTDDGRVGRIEVVADDRL